ncbi:MAG: UMP kinase [Deltaproteobacteria bacterium]|nr:UMP kinase [Deltaproteobacteria bacterium]
MEAQSPLYKRILLKLSGEALIGEKSYGIDPDVLKKVADEVHTVHNSGVETAVVIGGGNIFRGLNSSEYGMERAPADHMGMLATLINALALSEAINALGSETRVMSAIDMRQIAEPFIREKAINHLKKGRIVLFGAGTGNPFFSTDTAAALRAMEIKADVLLKATKVDGIFESDPEENPSAMPFKTLTYQDFLKKRLKVMDMTAVTLAMGQNLPIIVFNLRQEKNILKVVRGEKIGTIITGG